MLDLSSVFPARTSTTRFQPRVQQGAWLLATALILISPFGNAAERKPDAPENIPAELEGEAWQQISAQIEADRHRMREAEGQWQAHTPGQRYSTRFGPEGPELEVRDGERSHNITFRFKSARVDGQPLALSAPKSSADDNRMEYRRGALTEWYVNRPEGLEQGFTIDRAPAGDSLSVELSLDAALAKHLSDNELILTENGRHVFRYAGLKAWDAEGRTLATQMELDDSRLALQVDVSNAHYPVTVDPVMFNETAKFTPDLPIDAFANADDAAGYSVSVDGDRALVGAQASGDEGFLFNGEAFMFEWDSGSGSWEFVARLAPSDLSEDMRFGWSVSLSGDRALVGAWRDDVAGNASGSAYIFDFDGTDWNETVKLLPDDGADDKHFGMSVSLSGDRALIGAEGDDDNGSFSGSAYVFDFDGTSWNQTVKLLAGDGDVGDFFGQSVSLSGNRALVGAVGDDDNGITSGSAYVFDFDGANWNQTDKLLADDGAESDQFGNAVSLSGDRALVGAYQDDDNGSNSGSAYVFDFDGTGWNQTDKLLPGDGAQNDEFGRTVSLSGDRALVGAYGDDDNGSRSGSAYVFDLTGTGWNQTDKLLPGDAAAQDRFGYAVSLSGNRALIGAPQDDDNGSNSGSAYVFDFDGTNWNETTKLPPGNGAAGNLFGQAVSLSGDRALIGGAGDDVNGDNSGSAYVFEFDGTGWSKTAKLLPNDGAESDNFGTAVSLSGDRALVGARADDDNGSNSGSAYVFDFDGTDWNQTEKLLPDDGNTGDNFGNAVSLSGDRALVGAFADDDNGSTSGAAYVFDLTGTDWNQTEKLLPDDGASINVFGSTVSLQGDRALIGAYGNDDFTGAAYIFDLDGSWNETDKLVPGDAADNDEFGYAVSLSDDRALVGARRDDDNGNASGSAYIFDFDGTNWNETGKLLPGDGDASDQFGSSVSLSGDRALVGAHFDTDNGADSGSAYVFNFDSTAWNETPKLLPGDGAGGDEFGYAVSLAGNRALVGAYRDDDKGEDSGTAYIFVNNESPIAQPDSLSTVEDSTLSGDVLADNGNGPDTDPNGDPLSVTSTPVVGPANGSVTLLADGTFNYTPNTNFNGSDSFDYEVCDPTPECDTATVSITVGTAVDVQVEKSVEVTSLQTGASLDYTIVVTNPGPSDVSGVVVEDTPPAVLNNVTWTCTPTGSAACGTSNGSGSFNVTVDIPEGDSVEFQMSGTIPEITDQAISNTATATTPGGVTEIDTANNTDTETIVIGIFSDRFEG